MLLTLTTTHRPATDLGFLLHKHPARVHELELAFGMARVFYPEATEDRCTAALLLDIDPFALVRRRSGGPPLEPYVNDRPYAASSFLSVAIAKVFGTALGGRSRDRPTLAAMKIPLRAVVSALPSRGGSDWIDRLFCPLGYTVAAHSGDLDPHFPTWGRSPYFRVVLEGEVRLCDLLRHLYVLIPVLDDRKHYWIDRAEVDKLLRRGEGWLADHPQRDRIVSRYLKHRRHLTHQALERLLAGEERVPEAATGAREAEDRCEGPLRLHDLRLEAVHRELERSGARRVLDLGCGEGKLLRRLLRTPHFEQIVGVDASTRALEIAHRRLGLAEAPPRLRSRVQLLHGALTYRDRRLEGFDAATLVEVIEHLDPVRRPALEQVVWGLARPEVIIVTTPNRDYNGEFGLPEGTLRHPDHRFEWRREEFRSWATGTAKTYGYGVRFEAVGAAHEEFGAPTQMAVFRRQAGR